MADALGIMRQHYTITDLIYLMSARVVTDCHKKATTLFYYVHSRPVGELQRKALTLSNS